MSGIRTLGRGTLGALSGSMTNNAKLLAIYNLLLAHSLKPTLVPAAPGSTAFVGWTCADGIGYHSRAGDMPQVRKALGY